jgi:hypothetical protein
MSLTGIVENSNYVTDEEILTANILGIANTCIAEVNRRVGVALPFFEEDSLTDDLKNTYDAIPEYWVFALFEPYCSYAIMANDGDENARDFHYNRFISALKDFKDNGMGAITSSSYMGDNVKHTAIDVSDVTVHWEGWV